MFDHLTSKARRAMFEARQNAFQDGAEFIEGHHLLTALLSVEDPSVAEMLDRLGIALGTLRESLPGVSGRPTGPRTREIPFGPDLRSALEVAGTEGAQRGELGGPELLIGLFSTRQCLPPSVVGERHYTLPLLRAAAAGQGS